MGIEPFLVASSVEAVMAQRLVRTICPHCKTEQKVEKSYLRRIGFPEADIDTAKVWRGAGLWNAASSVIKGARAFTNCSSSTNPCAR